MSTTQLARYSELAVPADYSVSAVLRTYSIRSDDDGRGNYYEEWEADVTDSRCVLATIKAKMTYTDWGVGFHAVSFSMQMACLKPPLAFTCFHGARTACERLRVGR